MARSPWFHTLSRILQYGYHARRQGFSDNQRVDYYYQQKENTLSRRQFLARAGVGAGLFLPGVARAFWQERGGPKTEAFQVRPQTERPSVAIVGGGLAGLGTAYYLLTRYGIVSAIYDAGEELGGRVCTEGDDDKTQFNSSRQILDLGGQFIDLAHTQIRSLCRELGVRLISKTNELDFELIKQELFWYEGQYQTMEKVLRAFDPMVDAMLEKVDEICPNSVFTVPSYDSPVSPEMVKFDSECSLAEYLDSLEGRVDKGFLDMLARTYEGEHGADAAEQSPLNFFGMLQPKRSAPFAVLGESDELAQIEGGSSQLIHALERSLPRPIEIHKQHRLRRVRDSGNGILLGFETGTGESEWVTAPQVVFAVPFSSLRNVQGVSWFMGMRKEKQSAIRELGYGNSAKIFLGYEEPFWKSPSLKNVPASAGTIYSDFREAQMIWDMSRMQKGKEGILCFLLGGKHAEKHVPDRIPSIHRVVERIYPESVGKRLAHQQRWKYWKQEPNFNGGYTCPKPGQYVKFRGVECKSEVSNRLFFAGEHCHFDFGYMNSALASAAETTRQIARSRRMKEAPIGN